MSQFKPKCKTSGFSKCHPPVRIVTGNSVLISFVLCAWSCAPPRQLKCLPSPPPGGYPPPLVVVLMFTVSFFGTLSKSSFGSVCGHIGPQYCQNWLQNDVILRSESCLAHLLEIALPPRREHHFHCFERSSNHLFLSTFQKTYFGTSI